MVMQIGMMMTVAAIMVLAQRMVGTTQMEVRAKMLSRWFTFGFAVVGMGEPQPLRKEQGGHQKQRYGAANHVLISWE